MRIREPQGNPCFHLSDAPMDVIPGYQVSKKIYESANTLVYKALRERDNVPVVLKILKENYPTKEEIVRYKQEFYVTRHLDFDGVARAYDLEKYNNTLFIVLEDCGAISLDTICEITSFALSDFLDLAIKITDSLSEIHGRNVIHKDINPSNIIFNQSSGVVKIIDFGISTVLPTENATIKSHELIEGTLPYISPEQTGRMRRHIDYRTDFYSLGVSFYELLTQTLPFNTEDPLELIHHHIAQQPIPPHLVDPDIPEAVSLLVMKLLAKTAEDRYESAEGIKKDLEHCRRQLENGGHVSMFALGTHDVSPRLNISPKLYGRDAEINMLDEVFERVEYLEKKK